MNLLDSFHLYGSVSSCSKQLLQLVVGDQYSYLDPASAIRGLSTQWR